MADQKVGVVTHYYDKIGVGIVKLLAPLALEDTIKIVGGDGEFSQTLDSMQVEHENIQKGKKGDVVGIKLNQPVKDKWEVFKV